MGCVFGMTGNYPYCRNSSGARVAGSSDAEGVAEAIGPTAPHNKKGFGGTTPGSYTATTTRVTADGYEWDGQMTSAAFTLQ